MFPNLASLALLLLSSSTPSGGGSPSTAPPRRLPPRPASQLFLAAAGDFQQGALLEARGGPPWFLRRLVPTDGAHHLRAFGAELFALHSSSGTVQRFTPRTGALRSLDLGAGREPVDVLVAGSRAYVTVRDETALLGLDFDGAGARPPIDLRPLARPGERMSLGTLIRDGARMFVQVTLTDPAVNPPSERGLLAVIQLATEQLLDVDPRAPGTQGIELAGAPPQHKMQVLSEARRLYVSSTQGLNDGRGAIEEVDLERLASAGFVLSEKVIGDLGGFVMTSTAGGYFVFHTDLTASTHLKPFTVAGGPAEGPEMVVLFDIVDTLVYDPGLELLYLPGGHTNTGLHVFDTRNNERVGRGVAVGLSIHDLVLTR